MARYRSAVLKVALFAVTFLLVAVPAFADETATPEPSVTPTQAVRPMPAVRLAVTTVVRTGKPLPLSVRVNSLDASSSTAVRLEFQRYDVATRTWKPGGMQSAVLTLTRTVGTAGTTRVFGQQGPWRARASYARSADATRAYSPWQSVMVCGDKVIALTFDDGPDRRDTPIALAALRAHQARATFFMMGRRVEKNPAIVRRMHFDGHQLGNHTWDHINAATQTRSAFRSSVIRTNAEIMDALRGRSATTPALRFPLAFRYPWGSGTGRTEEVLRSLGMRSYGWSYATGDGGTHGPLSGYVTDLIANKVINNAAPNSVILLHDGRDRPNTVAAIPKMLDALSARGYVFVTLEDMRRLRAQDAIAR